MASEVTDREIRSESITVAAWRVLRDLGYEAEDGDPDWGHPARNVPTTEAVRQAVLALDSPAKTAIDLLAIVRPDWQVSRHEIARRACEICGIPAPDSEIVSI